MLRFLSLKGYLLFAESTDTHFYNKICLFAVCDFLTSYQKALSNGDRKKGAEWTNRTRSCRLLLRAVLFVHSKKT